MPSQSPSSVNAQSGAILLGLRELSVPLSSDAGRQLRVANWQLRLGDCVELRGDNGVGKSLMLRAAVGLIAEAQGHWSVSDQPVDPRQWPLLRRQVVYVNGRAPLLAGSVRENFASPWQWLPESAPEAWFRDVWTGPLGFAGELLEQDAATLSQGQRQVLALLRAMALQPQVLLCDEVESGMAKTTRAALAGVMREWWQQGRAVAYVSHGDQLWAEFFAADPSLKVRRGHSQIAHDRCEDWP